MAKGLIDYILVAWLISLYVKEISSCNLFSYVSYDSFCLSTMKLSLCCFTTERSTKMLRSI